MAAALTSVSTPTGTFSFACSAARKLLPAQPDGYRYANSDPITGQAAWYDLKVRLIKAGASEKRETSPWFPPLGRPPGLPSPARILRYGAAFRGRREGGS